MIEIQNNFEHIPNSWTEGLSDPNDHNPDRYRYLVHAFNPMAKGTVGLINAQAQLSLIKSKTPHKVTKHVDLFFQPERLEEREAISCSLIDQDHSGTWGDCGLMLQLQADPLITSSSDCGTIGYVAEILEEQIRASKTLSPNKLLDQTGKETYNEVVVRGKTANLRGFFVKVYEDSHEPLNPEMAKIIKFKAQSLNLPVVEIKSPVKKTFDCSFNLYSKSYNVCYGEYRLDIPTVSDKPLYATDREGLGFFPEWRWLLDIYEIYKAKMPGISIDLLKEKYDKYNKERLKPVVRFKENIDEISFVRGQIGAGKLGTREYFISEGKIVINNRIDNLRKRQSGNETLKTLDLEEWKKIDLDEVDKIRQHVLGQADQEVHVKLVVFFNKIKEKIAIEKIKPLEERFPQLLKLLLQPTNTVNFQTKSFDNFNFKNKQ